MMDCSACDRNVLYDFTRICYSSRQATSKISWHRRYFDAISLLVFGPPSFLGGDGRVLKGAGTGGKKRKESIR